MPHEEPQIVAADAILAFMREHRDEKQFTATELRQVVQQAGLDPALTTAAVARCVPRGDILHRKVGRTDTYALAA